jgi:glycosyltransferase involved in cell wall biosynthesis
MITRSTSSIAPGRSSPPRHLRLAILASSLRRGGAEKQTVYAARALFEAGMEIQFYYLGEGGVYESALRNLGIPLCQIYVPNRPGLMLARLLLALRQWQPDVVLASQFGDLLYGAIAGRCLGALTLGGVRSDGFYEFDTHGGLSRWMVRLAHGLVANSHRARQNLVSQGVDPSLIEVVPNVIDLPDFDARACLPMPIAVPAGRVIAAAVGSLHPCKSFDRFLEALALARRSEPGLVGVIAGADCGARSDLEAKARSLGLGPAEVLFAGECENVPALLSHAGLLVLSSDYEGFPNVILEAMAARLPVITTAVGDARSIVRHGQTGYVVDRAETQSMARYMIRLAQSPGLAAKFGQAGRQRVEQEFNFDSLAGRLGRVLRRIARRQRKASLLRILPTELHEQEPVRPGMLHLEGSPT